MEILSNFASIYCFITFVLGAMFMLAFIIIAAMGKTQEPKNNVHFYVEKVHKDCYYLVIKTKTKKTRSVLFASKDFEEFGLNSDDFYTMKDGEVREVFLNFED